MSDKSDVKYICTPLPSTPNGKDWEAFEERFLNALSTKVDDRGYSAADHILGNDENGPNGPPAHPQVLETPKR